VACSKVSIVMSVYDVSMCDFFVVATETWENASHRCGLQQSVDSYERL